MPKLFLSYGRRDAAMLANRLRSDLEKLGYEVWQDTREIRAGREWVEQIVDGLRSTQVVIALLSPHAVRRALDPDNPDCIDSVCLDELTFARFATPPKPIVPIMAVPCEPPFVVCRLDYVSMSQWMQSESEYRLGFERLVECIKFAVDGKPQNYRRWHHCLPVLDFAAQLYEKRRDFVGRQWLIDEIDAWRSASSSERALLVVGDPGIGKSAFVAEMIHRNPGGQVLAYHICKADDPETLRPSNFVMSLTGMIAGRLPTFADLLEAPHFQELLDPTTVPSRPAHVFDQGLISALHQLPEPPGGVRYILIDALDESLTLGGTELDIVTLLATRLERFPGWLRIVATTRREPNVLNRLSGLRASQIEAHGQDNLTDLNDFIEKRLQSPNLLERLSSSRLSVQFVQRTLSEKSEGNFLYIAQALSDIERDNYSFEQLDELPQGMGQWYLAYFARMFPNAELDFLDSRNLLEVLLAARAPLTNEQLATFAKVRSEYAMRDTLKRLSSVLRLTNGCIQFYHKSISDWLVTREGSLGNAYTVSVLEGHKRIAEIGWSEFCNSVYAMSDFQIRHLAYHLCRANAIESLADLLTNICYLEEKAKRGLTSELVADFDLALQVVPERHMQYKRIAVIHASIKADVQFISQNVVQHPHCLFQCLWNSCWWYDCPELKEHISNFVSITAETCQSAPLYELLERWLSEKELTNPNFVWFRSLRPPENRMGNVVQFNTGHEQCVTGLALTPDCKTLVSCARDGRLRIWDTKNLVLKSEIHLFAPIDEDGGKCIPCVAFSTDGKYLVSTSYGRLEAQNGPTGLVAGGCILPSRLKVWELNSLEERWQFQVFGFLGASTFSQELRTLALLDGNWYVYLFRIDGGHPHKTPFATFKLAENFRGFRGPLQLQFTPSGEEIIVSFGDASYVFQVSDFTCRHQLRGSDLLVRSFSDSVVVVIGNAVQVVTFSNDKVLFEWTVDGTRILAAAASSNAEVFWVLSDCSAGCLCMHVNRFGDCMQFRLPAQCLHENLGHDDIRLSVSEAGERAVLRLGNDFYAIEITPGRGLQYTLQTVLQFNDEHRLFDAMIHPNGKEFITLEGSWTSKVLRRYRITDAALLAQSELGGAYRILGYINDDDVLLLGGTPGDGGRFSQIHVLNASDQAVLLQIPFHGYNIQEPSFVSDKYILSICSDGILRSWDLQSGMLTDAVPLQELGIGEKQPWYDSFISDCTSFTNVRCEVTYYEINTSEKPTDIQSSNAESYFGCLVERTRLVVQRITGEYRGMFFEKVVVVPRQDVSYSSLVDLSPLPCVAFTSDRSILAVADWNSVFVWHAESQWLQTKFVDQEFEVAAVAMDQSSNLIYTAGFDRRIRIRDLTSVSAGPNYVHSICPRIHKLRSELLGEEPSRFGPNAEDGWFNSLCVLPYGRLVCNGYSDSTKLEMQNGVVAGVLNDSFRTIRLHKDGDIVYCQNGSKGFEYMFRIEGVPAME